MLGGGNLFDAFLSKQPGWNFPSYYLTHTDDLQQYEWLVRTKTEPVKQAHLSGKLDIPGFLLAPESMPASLLEEPPVPPALSVCAASTRNTDGEKTCHIAVTDAVIQGWHHKEDVQQLLKYFHDEFGVFASPQNGEQGKRNADALGQGDTPNAKTATDA